MDILEQTTPRGDVFDYYPQSPTTRIVVETPPPRIIRLRDPLTYRNEVVVKRIAKEMNIPKEEAEALFLDALRFLSLSGTTPIVPSVRIDAGWHQFVLHTKDYAAFCEEHIGHFVHHNPTEGKPSQSAKARTLALAVDAFGKLSSNWKYKGNCVCESQCDAG